MDDEELIAIARGVAARRGHGSLVDAQVVRRDGEVAVLLCDPAYARGGGLLVVVDPATGHVSRVVPAL
ncbi:hypothetical protein [Dactylosporangium sp. CA-139066]|uniref:hypothetical protein n=1 Tax=Dactylosporangium sp. CA-139066 TaxID=3239930 RepID=UPI003D937368